ncbi:NAD(P)H-dependent oxidoreductase [Bdellovibrio sp. HCB274]|uniref:NAD(P)H-dependent oxidoreductase n=1 Tax=Bdellovibrio sp. HCB274 TaxID=3394361 RepID=UPI0039B4A0E0
MARKVLIIQGHPDSESFNHALHNAYKAGAIKAGSEVKEIFVGDLDFNLNLQFGYRKRTELEGCLLESQEKIRWADHIVCIHPVWWGAVPAVLKGFFDRVLLPGFAFKKREGSLWWDRFLTGKTAHIISTMDQPSWYYRLIYGAPTDKALKKLTFEFCGIKPVKITHIGPVRMSTSEFRAKWLAKVEQYGSKI